MTFVAALVISYGSYICVKRVFLYQKYNKPAFCFVHMTLLYYCLLFVFIIVSSIEGLLCAHLIL